MTRLCDIKRRENAVRRYELNPSTCKKCGKKIEIDFINGPCPSDAKRRKFCSKSCAAKWNNSDNPKRKKDKTRTTCSVCGGKKSHSAKICHSCKRKRSLRIAWKSPIKKYYMYGASRTKYASIRKWANIFMEDFDDRDKKCEVCGYTKVVQVAHKKAICDFLESDLMEKVNSKSNLVWLCPNHHAEFDKGILMLPSYMGSTGGFHPSKEGSSPFGSANLEQHDSKV